MSVSTGFSHGDIRSITVYEMSRVCDALAVGSITTSPSVSVARNSIWWLVTVAPPPQILTYTTLTTN